MPGENKGKKDKAVNFRSFVEKLIANPHSEAVILVLLLAIFSACATYFAFRLNTGIIPDEPSHFYLSSLFSSTCGIPKMTDEAFTMGFRQFDRQPYLYHWIGGRLLFFLKLIIPGMSEWRQMLFLRMTSVVYSVLTVLYIYYLAMETLKNRWWPLLSVFLTSMTLMFVFMAGGVSYDALTNLCAAAGIYYLVKTLQGKKILTNSMLWILFIGIGALVKKTILPLALVMALIWLIYLIRNRKSLDIRAEFQWQFIVIAILFLSVVSANLAVYGVNLVKYQQIIPSCRVLHPQEKCDLSVFKQRAEDLKFPEEKLTLQQVIEQKKPDPVNYFFESWLKNMEQRVYGILGHKYYFPVQLDVFYSIFYLLLLVFAVKYWGKRDTVFYALFILTIAYFGTIFIMNYDKELTTNFRNVALQGRYLFPVLAPFYVLVVEFISRITPKLFRRLMVIYALVLFSAGGPVNFLLRVASRNNLDWFH